MKRILIVEDEPEHAGAAVRPTCGDAGYEAAAAGDGIEAVSLFQRGVV
ncbi:MAG: hypothetical protein ACLSE4_15685 [Clostridium sp.]